MIALLLLACGSGPSSPAPSPGAPAPSPPGPHPPGAPAPVPAAPVVQDVPVEPGPDLVGLCDASAALQIGRFLVVADDERNQLQVFDWEKAASPVAPIDLSRLSPKFSPKEEADLEGMALLPDGTAWFVASHDAGKKGTERLGARQRLGALQLTAGEAGVEAKLVQGPTADLIERGQYTNAMYGIMLNTAGKTSKDPLGLSIEGLAAGPGASLLIGFRNPVHAGKALIERLDNPVAFVAGGEPVLTGPRWLVLDGGGIRSLEADDAGGWLLVSGPSGDADSPFGLWRWRGFDDGTPPERLPVSFGDLHPEALVKIDGAWWVLSDDGTRELGGEKCKELPPDQRRARTARVVGVQ